MAVRKFKPVTAGTRHKIIGTFDEITKSTPEKSLLSPKKSTGGRNNVGKMTVRYIGGGHKQMYRLVDFKRSKDGIPATVKSIEYDPNRTGRIALLVYADGEKSYIIAPNGLQVGQTVMSGAGVAPEVGNTLFLSETRMVLVTCRATVGVVSNIDHSLESSGKAGRERWRGRRPRNRGVVMNPVDHPMGGGEGRASGGHPRSRKGLLAKGYKTRNPKKTTSKFIISKKKK